MGLSKKPDVMGSKKKTVLKWGASREENNNPPYSLSMERLECRHAYKGSGADAASRHEKREQ
jgi:hypothetical protein